MTDLNKIIKISLLEASKNCEKQLSWMQHTPSRDISRNLRKLLDYIYNDGSGNIK